MNRLIVLLLIFSSAICVFAENSLIVRPGGASYSYNGYIDTATLVVEPHGGYLEQALYLKYSDHNQFHGVTNIEIVHRFELPEGTVINDLWLWIGDSVMQARVYENWKARHIYDSIVNTRRDPAYLLKDKNQYELRVFPLISGQFRKVKINMISPVRFENNQALADLPLAMLKANNNALKPLVLAFRSPDRSWGQPLLGEDISSPFTDYADTNGFHYMRRILNDITPFSALTLKYQAELTGGHYFSTNEKSGDRNYFQYSINLKDAFNLQADSSGRKVHIALDLSGRFFKSFSELWANLSVSLKVGMGSRDSFKLTVAGLGKIKPIVKNWKAATEENVNAAIVAILFSTFGDSLLANEITSINYSPKGLKSVFDYCGLSSLANAYGYVNLFDALPFVLKSGVYFDMDHYYGYNYSEAQIKTIVDTLHAFFNNGGVLIVPTYSYYFNAYDKIVHFFIPSINSPGRSRFNIAYPNRSGVFGNILSQAINASNSNIDYLTFDDNGVTVELSDADNRAIAISKKIDNGLLIISGMYPYDANPREPFINALLGLHKSGYPAQGRLLLQDIKAKIPADGCDKILFVSNSLESISRVEAEQWVSDYMTGLNPKPLITTINLVNNLNPQIPKPSITSNGYTYYGLGYLQKRLAEATNGFYFDRSYSSWPQIQSAIVRELVPQPTYISFAAKGDNDPSKIKDFYEVTPMQRSPGVPLNYVGSTTANELVTLQVSAKFPGSDSLLVRTFNDPILPPSVTNALGTGVKRSILANEKIIRLFDRYPVDTAQVISLAVDNRVLCDYSAFLALEPNDTIHFIHPFDEWGMLPVKDLPEKTDSIYFGAYPNPFNALVTFKVQAAGMSNITLRIYNILGQQVKVIAKNEELAGGKTFQWNARDESNSVVSSGIYFARIEIKDSRSGKLTVRSQKIVLLK